MLPINCIVRKVVNGYRLSGAHMSILWFIVMTSDTAEIGAR